MYKTLFSIIVALLFVSNAWGQTARYVVVSAETESPTIVKLQIKTFCHEKDLVDAESQCAAVRAVIFDGIPNTYKENCWLTVIFLYRKRMFPINSPEGVHIVFCNFLLCF